MSMQRAVAGLVFVSLLISTDEMGSPVVGPVDLRSAELTKRTSSEGERSVRVPKRVVSSSLLSDELLHGILPWQRWAGVSYVVDWSSSTPLAGSFPERISRTSGKTEDLLARGADLVVLSPYNSALTALQLRSAGQETFVLQPSRSFEELFAEYRRLGARIGLSREVETRISDLHAELSETRRSSTAWSSRPRALLLQGMFSYGPNTLIDECLNLSGFESVLSGRKFGTNPSLNVEHLLGLDPDVVIVAAEVNDVRRAQELELKSDVPWKGLRAYRAGRIFVVPKVVMSSISHHAILSCRAFSTVRKELGA